MVCFVEELAFVLYHKNTVQTRLFDTLRAGRKKSVVCCDNPLAYLYFLEGRKKNPSQVIVAGLGVTLKNVKQRKSDWLTCRSEGIEDFTIRVHVPAQQSAGVETTAHTCSIWKH